MTEIHKKGLRQRIKEAFTEDKVNELLKEGEGYKEASPRVRSAWQRTAERRINELRNPPKKKEKEAEEKKEEA